jgi:uncharacterized damage-inducible protein DinB
LVNGNKAAALFGIQSRTIMEQLEIIDALKHLPGNVEAELADVPESVLGQRPPEGGWSIKEVVGHLWFADEIWYRRLYMVWSMHDPLLISFAGEEAALESAYAAPDVRPFVSELRTRRPRIVDLLSHAVDWTRTGQWPGEGRRSLKQLAEYLVQHDADHLAQIRTLKTAQRAETRP